MFPQTLLNPFTRIAGFSALWYGCLFMLLTAAIAAPCGVNFVGSLNIHVARPMPFALIFSLLISGWISVATVFYVAGLFFSQSKIRAVDIYGTFALARAPFLIVAPFGLLPGLWNLDPLQPPPTLLVFGIIALLVDIWVVILSYHAFAVSANVKSKWLFTAIFIVSEVVAVVLSGLFATWMPPPPVGNNPANPAAVAVDQVKVPINDDIRDIAERFVRQIVEGDTDAVLQSYSMTDEFRAAISNANAVRGLASNIDQFSGRLGDVVDSEIVEHQNLGLRSVYLYYQGTKQPVKIWVTFSGTKIDGIHRDTWAEGYTGRQKAENILANMSVAMSLLWGVVLNPVASRCSAPGFHFFAFPLESGHYAYSQSCHRRSSKCRKIQYF